MQCVSCWGPRPSGPRCCPGSEPPSASCRSRPPASPAARRCSGTGTRPRIYGNQHITSILPLFHQVLKFNFKVELVKVYIKLVVFSNLRTSSIWTFKIFGDFSQKSCHKTTKIQVLYCTWAGPELAPHPPPVSPGPPAWHQGWPSTAPPACWSAGRRSAGRAAAPAQRDDFSLNTKI